MGMKSEIEWSDKEIVAHKMIEYIQSVIVSTPPGQITIREFDDPDAEPLWNELLKNVERLYVELFRTFQITQTAFLKKTDPNFDLDYMEYYREAQSIWTYIRSNRYPIHDLPHLKDLLSPHDEVFRELFEISIDIFLEGLSQIEYSLSHGMGDTIIEMNDLKEQIYIAIQKEYSEENPIPSFEELQQRLIREFDLENKSQSFKGRIRGYDLFDLEKLTKFPSKLLRELSWEPGEERNFFEPGEYCGWPLRLLPIKLRPFLRIDSKYYNFDPINLMDNIYRIIKDV
jgi:hypothetical protein